MTPPLSSKNGDPALPKQTTRKPQIVDEQLPRTDVQGAWIGVKVILVQLTQMWLRRNTLRQEVWDRNKSLTKKILLKSQQEPEIRLHLGTALDLWEHFTSCFANAIMALKAQSYLPQELDGVDPDEITESSSEFMASHASLLLEDLERLNDLLLLSRNMLATNARIAQDYAFEAKFDKQVLQLVDHCVRMVARGYDSTPGLHAEATFNGIIHSYKRVLVTSLQFLHNLVTQNESRKLYLWLDLFCAPPNRILGTVDTSSLELVDSEGGTSGYNAPANEAEINNKFRLFYGPFTANFPPIDDDQFTELTLFTRWFAKNLAVALPNEVPLSLGGDVTAKLPDLSGFTDLLNFEMLKLSDMMTTVTIEQAIEEIRIAKRELIPALRHPVGTANLEESEPPSQHNIIELGSVEGDGIPDSQDEYDQSDDAGEDDLDDGDDELGSYVDDHQPRGSLTDIPLVLGPTEIEALPLIIQSAIFSARDITMMSNEQRLLQAVRCQLLLTQKPGHYLLRELLIFIAAWDLKETELYFKLMMHIMEAMMLHGLIPYAYRTFNEGKDIVSPAQAILLKILLQIFRSKRERGYPHHPSEEDTTIDALPSGMNPEIVLINFLLNTFRREVIPRTVALIWMQGQIRAGAISAASFPMNLWDMERVYEGVYQYIELFSFLNETAAWRSIIVDSNFTFELLTLIRVLEDNCPKIPVFQGKKPAVIATEDDMQAPNLDLPSHPEHPTADGRPSDSATPRGVNSNEPTSPSPAPSSPFVTNPSTSPPFVTNAANPMDDAGSATSEDASSFTWQNLKKLAVLALSSFAFNSPIVRTQVRELGGIELILACTAHDMANPFIREHAMLCVKFLLEGDEANQGIVKKLFEESSKVAKGVEMGADSSTAEGKAMDEKVWAKIASEQGLGGLSIRERKLSPEETEFLTGSHEGR